MTAPRYVIAPISGETRSLLVGPEGKDDVAQVWGETPEEAQRRAEIVLAALEGGVHRHQHAVCGTACRKLLLEKLRNALCSLCCYCGDGFPKRDPHVHQSAPDVACYCEEGADA